MPVKHTKTSTVSDDADTTLVRPSDWNADHTITDIVASGSISSGSTITSGSSLRIYRSDAKIEFGNGANVYDTNLYRNNANELKTDDGLIVGTELVVGRELYIFNSGCRVLFGDGAGGYDTSLFRNGANILKTDDNFVSGSNIQVVGNFQSYKNSTAYTGYMFVPLAIPLTSASWTDAYFSTGGPTLIDTSASFSGCPPGVKALLLSVTAEEGSATWGSDEYFIGFGGNSSYLALICSSYGNQPASGTKRGRQNGIVPCNADGDIYWQTYASGTDTLRVNMQIYGYWI